MAGRMKLQGRALEIPVMTLIARDPELGNVVDSLEVAHGGNRHRIVDAAEVARLSDTDFARFRRVVARLQLERPTAKRAVPSYLLSEPPSNTWPLVVGAALAVGAAFTGAMATLYDASPVWNLLSILALGVV